MIANDESLVWIDMRNPLPGRINAVRTGRPHPLNTEPYPVITPEDREATRRIAKKEGRLKRKDELAPTGA